MLKQIIPLLFTFIFSINLFAQAQDINKEITDVKLQLQEIKLLDARDEREKKIEKLEKDIKELDDKFNQNNIDKKEIDGKIGTQDKLITEIGSNTNRISWIISLFGVLITIIVIYFVFKFEKMAEILAEKELKKWIKNEAMGEFEPKIKEIKDLIKKAESEVRLFKEKAELTINGIEKKLLENKELTHEEENEIKSDIKDIENKQEKDYTFADWRKKTLLYFISNKYEEALKLVENMLIFSDDNLRISETLFLKAIILNKLNKNLEAIEVYDELIDRFKDSKESGVLVQVTKALYNKGVRLGKLEKSEEAIEVYDELIERFKDSKESGILEQVVSSLSNKIETNLILGNTNSKEDLDLYFDLIKENKQQLLGFEMLQIFEKAKDSNQDDEIKEWKIKFNDTKLSNEWSFTELKTWSNTLESDAKERILRYIDIFENHNKNIKVK